MKFPVDLVRENRGRHEFPLAGIHQVEMDMRIGLQLGMIGQVHVGDDLALANPLAFLDQDEGLVEADVSGVDHWFDTVVKVNGLPLFESDGQGDSVTVVRLAFIEDTVKHLALLKGLIDPGNVTIGDGINGWVTSWLAGIKPFSRRLEVDVGACVRLGGTSALVGVTGSHVAPVDHELGAGLRNKLANVGERFGCLRAGAEQAREQDQQQSRASRWAGRRWLRVDPHDRFRKRRFDSRLAGVAGEPVALPFERLALSQ